MTDTAIAEASLLVVEDEPNIRELLATSLRFAGFEVSVASFKVRFVPVSTRRGGQEHRRGLMDWLDYYGRDKVVFRFTRPSQR